MGSEVIGRYRLFHDLKGYQIPGVVVCREYRSDDVANIFSLGICKVCRCVNTRPYKRRQLIELIMKMIGVVFSLDRIQQVAKLIDHRAGVRPYPVNSKA